MNTYTIYYLQKIIIEDITNKVHVKQITSFDVHKFQNNYLGK